MAFNINTITAGVNNIDELKSHLSDFEIKEDDDHLLIFGNNEAQHSSNDTEMKDAIKSVVIDKETLKVVTTQFNNIIYNDDTIAYLADKKWADLTIKVCYEGTMMLVFYSHDKWYVSTRRCLDSRKSLWIKGSSHYDLFMDAIKGKFSLDDLNKNYCYHFVLIHNKNKNIVDYRDFGIDYKTVSIAMITEKYTHKNVPVTNETFPIKQSVMQHILYPSKLEFGCVNDIVNYLDKISCEDRKRQIVTCEGVIVEHRHNDTLTILKMQSPLYRELTEVKANNSNIDAVLLGFYQSNLLPLYANYFSNSSGDVINRIHEAMKTLSNEFLDIYHLTRNHKNEKLYDGLPPSYRHAIYDIHKIYLDKRAIEQKNNKNNDELRFPKSITIHDVYGYLKKMPLFPLCKLFIDRLSLIENAEISKYLRADCMYAYVQGKVLIE